MSMLAEHKTKASWVLNPRASDWSKDQNKLGQKMLEKMGWSAGKGLGAKEQGPVEAIRIKYKGDSRGLGSGRKKEQEDWLQQQESFQSLLEGLSGTSDRSVKVRSLEEKSKTTRTKIHYHKFARGKDISRYSEKDLSCIVGSGFVPIKLPEPEPVSTPGADTGSANEDCNACVEHGADDNRTEESMYRERSRSGRELKPSAKVAAILGEGVLSLIKKKKTDGKPAELDLVVPQSKSESQSHKRTSKGREVKQPQVSASTERLPSSPKKKKTKEKCTESTHQSENDPESAIESSGDHKDREHSRSGRAYKPTAKTASTSELWLTSPLKKKKKERSNSESGSVSGTTVKSDGGRELSKSGQEPKPSAVVKSTLNERSPSPKKKKTKDKTKSQPESESGSESSVRPEAEPLHSKSGQEHKPSAKVLASSEERASLPKKKKSKENPAEIGKDVHNKPGSSKAPVVSASVDHSHSRSGREYKPSAKVMAIVEEKSSSKAKILNDTKNTVKDEPKKREHFNSEGSSSQIQPKKQKMQADSAALESAIPPNKSPKKKSPKNVTPVSSEVDDHGAMRKSSRKRISLSESSNEAQTERIKCKKPTKKVEDELHNDQVKSQKSKSVNPMEMNALGPSKQAKKKKAKKNAPESPNHVAASKTTNEAVNREPDHSAGEEHSPRKRLRKKDMVSVDNETLVEPPKPGKKKKRKVADETASSDQPSSSSAVAPFSSKSGRLKSSENDMVENGVADAELDGELPGEEPKRKRKKKRNFADESAKEMADAQESSPTKRLKKDEKKKTKKQEPHKQETLEASDNNEERDSDTTESPRKKKRENKKVNSNIQKPEDKEVRPAGTKTRKKKEKPAAIVDRLESSESQETIVSKRQDSEDTMEELASINSQSSLIYEMIGSAPNTLKVGNEPDELKKYHILASDSSSAD